MLAIRDAAIMSFQSICWKPLSSAIPTDRVLISGELVRMKANIYSFHEVINEYMQVEAIPGNVSGSTTLQNVCQTVHPSIRAASSNSNGSDLKKPIIIHVLNGIVKEI